MKILCYELNEVPWRVVDFYLSERPNSNLAKLLESSHTFTTRTVDTGELHPWTTWPTVHRGVSNDKHGIRYLNQDLSAASEWPPLWEILQTHNIDTGLFGSLQSYPPSDSDNSKFHVPDTFAPKPNTFPSKYEPFQAFNLAMTGENRAVTSSISAKDAVKSLELLRSGIRPTTLFKVFLHLLNEVRNPLYKSRRPTLQPLLAFDVFLDCLSKQQPDYVTFFSNHVAGIMHRYWRYTFPEDFAEPLVENEKSIFHKNSLVSAMDIFDEHIRVLSEFAQKHGYKIVIASSMGQEAIDRGQYKPELGLKDFASLLAILRLERGITLNLAMQPDLAFEANNVETLNQFAAALDSITDIEGEKLIPTGYESVGLTLNRKLVSTASLIESQKLLVEGKVVSLAEAGLHLFERDQGTGYHQPDGILIWQSESTNLDNQRRVVDSRQFLPTVLSTYGITLSDYMMPDISIT